jgi:hypothetical protein
LVPLAVGQAIRYWPLAVDQTPIANGKKQAVSTQSMASSTWILDAVGCWQVASRHIHPDFRGKMGVKPYLYAQGFPISPTGDRLLLPAANTHGG